MYVARSFPSPTPPGVVISGEPKDRTRQMQLGPGQHIFTLETREAVKDPNKFFEQYGWTLVSTKGFLN
jgi:hypothetical protein